MLILSQMVLMLDILEMFLNFHYLTYIRIDENANSEQRQVRQKRSSVIAYASASLTSFASLRPGFSEPWRPFSRSLARTRRYWACTARWLSQCQDRRPSVTRSGLVGSRKQRGVEVQVRSRRGAPSERRLARRAPPLLARSAKRVLLQRVQ